MQNTSNTYTNVPQKGLVTDLDGALVPKEYWTHARNAVHNSHKGNLQFLQDEPSNYRCVDLPYTAIGFIKILNNRWVVFTTDNTNSEIGVFDETHCSYTMVVNNPCLKFNTSNLIRGTFKETFDCGETVYWTDGVNPRRKLQINEVPYTYTTEDDACLTKTFTNQLDCDSLLVSPIVGVPRIIVQPGNLGSLQNGSYQVGIAYTLNKERITNYYSITQPQSIWSSDNSGKSLVVDIQNLDRDFDQYELVVIYTQKNTTTAKSVGFFPTSTSRHEISNLNRPEYITLPLEEVTIDRPNYFTADEVVSNDQYLLWSGVKSRPEINYQPQAMDIRTKWVMYQVPANYYAQGGNNRGYFRDEVYSFAIQWLFKNGDWSNAYHIAGRKHVGDERNPAVGKDVFEKPDTNGDIQPKRFEVYDTSRNKRRVNFTSQSKSRPIQEGDMSYWESTRLYPDNSLLFGEDACTPIRHHKFPQECTVPRYKSSGEYIHILGVKFENIEHPKDSNGKYIDDVVGYRIVRGDREGNRSVITKGLFSNVRSYRESLEMGGNGEEVLFSNYPLNDLRPDTFLSSQQVYFQNGEKGYRALTEFKNDQFNFYSPGTLFGNVGLGDEVYFDTEEIADVLGNYVDVFNHPRSQTVKNSVFWLAILVGAIDGVLSVFGKKCVTSMKDGIMNVNVVTTTPPSAGNITYTTVGQRWVEECETLLNGLAWRDIVKLQPIEAIAKGALKVLQSAAKAGMGVYFAFKTANEIIATVKTFLPWEKHAVQYNGHANFNRSKCILEGNRRRHVDFYQYIYDGINVVEGGAKFNNSKREKSVYIKLNAEVPPPTTQDNSRKTISEAGICDNPYKSFKTTASMFYGGVKRRVPDQYGSLDSIMYLDTGYLQQELTSPLNAAEKIYHTDTVFGGDVFISKISVNKHHEFFRQNLANANFPDGTEYDYSLYRNIGFPRFWHNTEEYDISELVAAGRIPNRLPANKYNFDCFTRERSNRNLSLQGVKGKYYLASNAVMEFFVESEYNLDFRDRERAVPSFYSRQSTNLEDIFRSDRWEDKEEFLYDYSHSKLLTENYIVGQRLDFEPTEDEKCFTYYKNRVIYSLPAFREQRGDNWTINLANNYYDFPLADFGNLTAMQPIDNQQIMFLFDKASPYVTIGRDELQTENGIKVTIGDGGLFARQPRPVLYTDYAYGNSQSRFAFVNTQFGAFYPSQRQGRVFQYANNLKEVSRNGMHWWFKEYLPSKLLADFPDFRDSDNPVAGVGLLSGFDNTDEKYYLTKIDYTLKPEYRGRVTYNPTTNKFANGTFTIKLGDPEYFENASFTISYSPKDEAFISWHDWHPNWILQGERHFMTVKGNGIWKHNELYTSYCNFYGEDKPFELEYVINNGQTVETLRNVEYILEAGRYFNEGRDFHHILDENFDYAVVFNSEQISGYLKLVMPRKNDINAVLEYPKRGFDEYIIKYDKEEHKYRFNQFWDITKDRGEFTGHNYPLWRTEPNGYVKSIVPQSVNYDKSIYQRKKFRHMQHRVLLIKTICDDKKIIFKFANAPQLVSFR